LWKCQRNYFPLGGLLDTRATDHMVADLGLLDQIHTWDDLFSINMPDGTNR